MIEELISQFSEKYSLGEKAFLKHSSQLINNWNDYTNCKNLSFDTNLQELATEFNGIGSSENQFDVLKFDKITDWHKSFQDDQMQNLLDGHNFNIFHLLRKEFDFRVKETMHSKLIKFLLDGNEIHGLGNLFLFEFLKLLGIDNIESGTWKVTAEQGKIDILIERSFPQSVIVIENKSNWASDQNHQLYRYWYKEIYLRTKRIDEEFYSINADKYQIIYLVPNSAKQNEEQTLRKPKDEYSSIYKGLPEKIPMNIVSMAFENEIQYWLENCKAKIPITNHRIREYISQYQLLCRAL